MGVKLKIKVSFLTPVNRPKYHWGLLLLLCGALINSVNAQLNSSISYDNYTGASSLISNPANIAHSKYKWNFGINYFQNGFTDYGAFPFFDFSGVPNGFNAGEFERNTRLQNNTNLSAVKNTNASDLSITGIVKLFPNHSIGFSIRSRTYGNYNNHNGPLWQKINEQFDENLVLETQPIIRDFSMNNQDILIAEQSWKEAGISYSGVLWDSKNILLAFGGTLKYLMGNGALQLNGDLEGDYILSDSGGNTVDRLTLDSGSNIAYFNTFDEVIQGSAGNGSYDFLESLTNFISNGSGIGADVGMVIELRTKFTNRGTYEINSQAINKYKLRIGVSVLDMGSIKYDNEIETASYQVNQSINTPGRELGNLGLLEVLRLQSESEDVSSSNVPGQLTFGLPTSININADYLIENKYNWFVNFNYSGALGSTKSHQNIRVETFSLTPRFEKSLFAIYAPITFQENLQIGLGVRYGPIIIGTNSLISVGDSAYNPNSIFISLNALKLEELFK